MEGLNLIEKPARYVGGEWNAVIKEDAALHVALCFADVYEVGMSHLGLQILYEGINDLPGVYAQRVFCPWTDRIQQMREQGEVLCSLEQGKPLAEFDWIGFNLSYEMSYTNVLAMLDLAGMPLYAAERGAQYPPVIGGGACTVNPEPLAPFFDAFVIGEGEEAVRELCALKQQFPDKKEFLREAAGLEGVYVPALYEVEYAEDGKIQRISPETPVVRRYVRDFSNARSVRRPVVPYLNTVHDRCVLEIMRGCPRGCRFCQAGFMTRPLRERDAQRVMEDARAVIAATGYEEISLCSLSAGDHAQIVPLVEGLIAEFEQQRVSVALPSLRLDSFEDGFAARLQQVRKTGLTFAPEAGSQRLRDVINKNITKEEILHSVRMAYASGTSSVKLYFMIGLPTETMEDLDELVALVKEIKDAFFELPKGQRNGFINITVSASCFVPKAGTPFQWEAQDDLETLMQKQAYLKEKLKMRGVKFNYHDADMSVMEAALARGDRRLAPVIERAYRNGAVFDAWYENFDAQRYEQAFADCGLELAWFATRAREVDEILPFAHLDSRISNAFLRRERDKAYACETTPECRKACGGCGLQQECKLAGGAK